MIFDRPIKDCPLFFDVTEHNPPLISFGQRGAKEKGFSQPCNVAVDKRNNVFVVDTGNSRVKFLTPNLDYVGHIVNEGLEGRSVTGICMGSSDDSLMVINWRSKTVTEISLDGHTIGSFTHDDLKEPIVSDDCIFAHQYFLCTIRLAFFLINHPNLGEKE